MQLDSLCGEIERLVGVGGGPHATVASALESIARAFGAATATLHRSIGSEARLKLISARGVPAPVLSLIQDIPFGKGMAGICAERRAPVTVCNLQCDASGVVRPGAKETGVAGAIVVPVFSPSGERVVGTLGIGKPGEHEYTEEERMTLGRCASILAPLLERL